MSNAKTSLMSRMLGFDNNQSFDGYPGMSCDDENLIDEAVNESEYEMRQIDENTRDPLQYLIYQASVHAKTPEQFDNARRFINEYVQTMWSCNMIEGSNKVYEARCESEEDCSL